LGVVLLIGYVAYKYALRRRERNKAVMNSAERMCGISNTSSEYCLFEKISTR
jgi:hypothetical protein